MIFFETKRLFFQRFELEDSDALAKITADDVVNRYVGEGPISREKTREWIEKSRRNIAQFGYGTGAVIEKNTGRLLVGLELGGPRMIMG